jgi:NAD-dependent dihydropyrimidine dehydrogenase PreA subunit
VAYVIAEPCIDVKDTACVDACPVDCIHPRRAEPSFDCERMLYIDPVECVHCSACVPVCPVAAIFSDSSLPNRWTKYEDINRAYYGYE